MPTSDSSMYIPAAFAMTQSPVQHDFIEQISFATLVTNNADGKPFVTHLPLLLDRDRGAYGTLVGHCARANGHWKLFDSDQQNVESLAIFHGPHAYISSGWYDPPTAVPTWNYAIVHVTGTARIVEDAAVTAQILSRTVERFEDPSSPPLPELDSKTHANLVQAVVAFEIPIAKIEAKFKLGQNRSAADQRSMATELRQCGNSALADLIESQQSSTLPGAK